MRVKFDRDEKVLRSIGAAPNGIVTIALDDDGRYSLGVSSTFEPTQIVPGDTLIVHGRDGFTEVDAITLARGCVGVREAIGLWEAVVRASTIIHDQASNTVIDPDAWRALADFAEEVRDALLEADWITPKR